MVIVLCSIGAASGSERASINKLIGRSPLATARGTDIFLFEFFDLFDTALMASAFEISGQKGANDPVNRLTRRRASADGDDVGVVVPAGQLRRLLAPGQPRADAGECVGRDFQPDTAPAPQKAASGPRA